MLCHVFWSQIEYKIICFISVDCSLCDEDMNSDTTVLPGVQDIDKNLFYNEDKEMISFVSLPENQEPEIQAMSNHIRQQSIDWPSVRNEPLSEFTTPYLATLAFPTLFPDAQGSNQSIYKHLIKFGEKKEGQWHYRFTSHPISLIGH